MLQPGGLRMRKQVSRGANVHALAPRQASQDRYSSGVLAQQPGKRKFTGPLSQPVLRAKSGVKVSNGRAAANFQQNVQKYSSGKENSIQGDVVNYLKDELLATWEAYLIPDYHRTVFLDCIYGLKPQQYSPIIVKEIEDLQNEKSPIQNTIRAIIARESCIS